MQLEWSDVHAAAAAAFNIWSNSPELAWAKQAWHLLEAQGLAEYDEEFGRHTAAFRLLALGGIYRDFCAVCWEEPTDRYYSEWAEHLDLSPLILGQLYAQRDDEPLTEEEGEVLTALVEGERQTVVDALVDGFGSDVKLYESLARSRGQEDTIPDEDSEDDFWSPSSRNLAGFEWVSQGCHPYLLE